MVNEVYSIYRASDGAATKRLYAELGKIGDLGVVALNLFRAQKCSSRAKKYGPVSGSGGRSYRSLAYERKSWSIDQLSQALARSGAGLGIAFGWGRDESQPYNKWVLYIDLSHGQVSFHSPIRYEGPDYPGEWDGRKASEERILRFCADIIKGGLTSSPRPTPEP